MVIHAEVPEEADLEGKQGFISSICGNFATVTRGSAPFSVYWPTRLLTPYEPPKPSDSDLRISVAHLREVLNKFVNPQGIVHESIDNIIEKVKSEI